MIGGTDVVIPTFAGPTALDACVRIIRRYWPQARYEDAITGEKYGDSGDLPIGSIRELFVYPNASAEAAWDVDSPDSPVNSMIYLILTPGSVTAVLDDPAAPEMRSILESMRNALEMLIPNTEAELFLGESA
jgi:hypothetical protein